MVSAWANTNKLVLGQVRTDEKSNKITAIPELLNLLEIKGCIVTIDAMGCQKGISKKIIEEKADYVFSLKGNQTRLNGDVRLYFEEALQNRDFYEVEERKTLDNGHGRLEKRAYYLTTDTQWLVQKSDWAGLNTIGMVRSSVTEKGVLREEIRYFITSLKNVKTFANAVRSHWGIENSLHWCLDVAFNEDSCRIRKDNSGENFVVIRHIAVNLLKKNDSKLSLKAKRHKYAYSDAFLHKILLSSIEVSFSCVRRGAEAGRGLLF
jgi:predicted transposase YbfD/YdcC